jgi:hypothetical protein
MHMLKIIRSRFRAGLHVCFSDRLDDNGVGSVLPLALLERVAGGYGQGVSCAVERQRGDAIIVLPRRLQTPPVDAVPHYDVAVAAAGGKGAKSRMECNGVDRIHNVQILGFVSDAVAFECVPARHRVMIFEVQRRKDVATS